LRLTFVDVDVDVIGVGDVNVVGDAVVFEKTST